MFQVVRLLLIPFFCVGFLVVVIRALCATIDVLSNDMEGD